MSNPETDTQQLLPAERLMWQPGWWMANVWLLFLLFPLITVVVDDEFSGARKIGTAVLIVGFGVVHALGYRQLIERELGVRPRPVRSGAPGLVDPNGPWLWFVLLVLIVVVTAGVGGWAALGMLPFLVSFAVFNLPFPFAAAVYAVSLAAVFVGPAIAGRLEDFWFLAVIVVSVGVAALLARLSEVRTHDVNALRTQLLISEERERVARDVHDVLGHSLTAIVVKAQVIDRTLALVDESSPHVENARHELADMQAVSRRALAEIRSTVGGLRAADISDELAAARTVLADAAVAVTIEGSPSAVPTRFHAPVAWAVREAVTNIVRHAQAEHCTIRLGGSDGAVLEVCDDGIGRSASSEGNGLTGLRERLRAADLGLEIDDGSGTCLRVIRQNDSA